MTNNINQQIKFKRINSPIRYILISILTILFSLPMANYNNASATTAQSHTAKIISINLTGEINPGTADFLIRGLKLAERTRANCFLVRLDTPGGLLISLRRMVKSILSSSVPVVIYVYPPGARAASAGTILCLSATIAAMSPGTNIGACHPVTLFGSMPKNSIMAQKLENDLVAWVKSIAIRQGRNKLWAEKAIRESISCSAQTALREHVINIIAPDVPQLLKSINNWHVTVNNKKIRLHTYPYQIIHVTPNLKEKLLSTISDPNIAYILLMIGLAGFYFEFAHPGGVFPGTIGAICMILALFAMQALPVNVTGLSLIMLAAILFLLELFITSHGILTISGLISLIIGSVFLFPGGMSGVTLEASVLYPTLFFIGGFVITITWLATKATLSRPKTGPMALIGKTGTVRKDIGPDTGMVFVNGELWNAAADSDTHIPTGTKITVINVNDMTLIVEPIHTANNRSQSKEV